MKKIMMIFMVLATFGITAQNTSEKREARKETKENFTPEQRAELHAKKMTLELDLNDSQQKKVKQLFLEMAKNKPVSPNTIEMTDQQKFEAKNLSLDRRIAMKRQLKEILSEDQFSKWEKSKQGKRQGVSRNKSSLGKSQRN